MAARSVRGRNRRTNREGREQLDALIRSYGYRIHTRETGQEPVWRIGKVTWKQSQVLLRIGYL